VQPPRGPPNPELFHQRRKTESRRPSLKPKPTSGTVQMQIIVADVATAGSCPAGKAAPAIALISAPRKDFVGPIWRGSRSTMTIGRRRCPIASPSGGG